MNNSNKRFERATFASEKKRGMSMAQKRSFMPHVHVGEEFDVTIEENANIKDAGVVHIDGFEIIVPNTWKGEQARIKIVKLKKNFAEAEIMGDLSKKRFRKIA